MLLLGLSVPREVPRCSTSALALLTGFLNSGQFNHFCHFSHLRYLETKDLDWGLGVRD